jgi:endonuclease YncB( thermonuclease family)
VVANVIDGDTIRLRHGTVIRLIGINAPELARDGRSAETRAAASRRLLRRHLPAGSRIGLVFDDRSYDRHRRRLAHVFRIGDGENVQALMLESGLAAQFTVPPNVRFIDCYRSREEDARRVGAGVWREERAAARFDDLANMDGAFVQVVDEVRLVRNTRCGIRLEMASGLRIFLDRRDLRYFRGLEPGRWKGKRAHLRGYLGKRDGRPYMRLRHPYNIRVIESLKRSQS